MPDLIVKTFGFKYGSPNANFYFDVSSLKNPARLNGKQLNEELDQEMENYVTSQPEFKLCVDSLFEICVKWVIPCTDCPVIAIGCNSGRHRSVVVAKHLVKALRDFGFDIEYSK